MLDIETQKPLSSSMSTPIPVPTPDVRSVRTMVGFMLVAVFTALGVLTLWWLFMSGRISANYPVLNLLMRVATLTGWFLLPAALPFVAHMIRVWGIERRLAWRAISGAAATFFAATMIFINGMRLQVEVLDVLVQEEQTYYALRSQHHSWETNIYALRCTSKSAVCQATYVTRVTEESRIRLISEPTGEVRLLACERHNPPVCDTLRPFEGD